MTGEIPDEIMAAVMADAERETGADPASIEVVQAEPVTWNDGSLGCPEPGMSYTQALVDGYHVVLDVGGERLDYRIGQGGAFRLCDVPGTGGESGDE